MAKAGYQVALIERDTNRRKPCGGRLKYRMLDICLRLRKLGLILIKGSILHSVDSHELEFVAVERS